MNRLILTSLIVLASTSFAAADTVLQYTFDDGVVGATAGTVTDSSPNNLHGTAMQEGTSGLPVYRNELRSGLQLELEGSGYGPPAAASYIRVDDPGVSPLDITGPITIEAIVRPDIIQQQVIVRKYGGVEGSGYLFDIEATGQVTFALNSDLNRVFSTTTLAAGETHHVAGTWDGTTMRVYIDYALEGELAFAGTLNANNSAFGVGAILRDDSTVGQGFDGLIDSVRLSNVALDPSDFQPLPEPSSFALIALGLAGLAVYGGRARYRLQQ